MNQKDSLEPNFDFVLSSDILDDLCCRFIINVPTQEKKDLVRICFQIEQAHWFYLDFYSNKSTDKLRPCSLKEFARNVFYHIRYLRPFIKDLDLIIDDWKEYKYSVPTFGAIILDEELKNILLVKSYWSKSSWGFPKGKINKDETPCHCASREVFEETGFNISGLIHPDVYVETIINEQCIRLYIVSGVSQNTKFSPQTRNEIKDIKWFPVDIIPIKKTKVKNKLYSTFYMVIPFMRDLRKWILQNGAPSVSKQRRSFKSFSEVEDLLHTTSVEPTEEPNIADEKKYFPAHKGKIVQQDLNSIPDNEVEYYEGSDEDDVKQSNEEIYGIPKVKLPSISGKESESYVLPCSDAPAVNGFHQKNGRSKQNNLESGLPNSYDKDLIFNGINTENNYIAFQMAFEASKPYQGNNRNSDKFGNTTDKNLRPVLLDKNIDNKRNVSADLNGSLNNVKLKGKATKNTLKHSYSSDNTFKDKKITNQLNELSTCLKVENQRANNQIQSNVIVSTNNLVSNTIFIQNISQNKAILAMKFFKLNKDALFKALEF